MNTSTAIVRTLGACIICLAITPAWGDEKDDRIQKLEAELAAKNAKIQQLEQDVQSSKGKISTLEEAVFVATDGKGLEKEKADVLPEGMYPWTEYMRRNPQGILFPKTTTIPEGEYYARISHVSQNQTFTKGANNDPVDSLLGLESGVKVGLMVGYGLAKDWDITVQRVNGRSYTRDGAPNYTSGTFDMWDVMSKVKLMDEYEQCVDLSLDMGTTVFLQDNGQMEFSGNGGLLVEKSVGRFRFGSGLLYASLSDFGATHSHQTGTAPDKVYINDAISPQETKDTLSIPFSVAAALTAKSQLFAELADPISGYHTGNGPSVATGYRYSTHTHSFSVFLSNTANDNFNSTMTGGYKYNTLDVFGFDVSVFF